VEKSGTSVELLIYQGLPIMALFTVGSAP